MRVLILAAGYGTRLYPLTLDLPKPLVPIGDKPLVNFLIEKIDNLKDKFPVEEIVIVSNNKFYESFLKWKEKYKVNISILDDGSNTPSDRLGAVKDIRFAIADKKDDWLILGGDNLFEDELGDFVNFALKKAYPCVGLHDVKDKKNASRYGIVKVDAKNRITELVEKPKNPFSTLAATCIYYFCADSLKFLDIFLEKEHNPDASGKYISWLVTQTKVYGFQFKGSWIDIGHHDALSQAEKKINRMKPPAKGGIG
jgi:glucose-1-phosphate thymidylyltransferase